MAVALSVRVGELESELAEVSLREELGFQKDHRDPGVNRRGCRFWRCRRDKARRFGRRRAA